MRHLLAVLLLSAAFANADPKSLVYLGLNEQGAEEWYRAKDGATVVRVPSGPFQRRPYEGGPAVRKPQPTDVAAFFIDKYEVTNAQFARFLNARHRTGDGHAQLVDLRVGGIQRTREGWRAARGRERHPVTAATGHGAAAFAKWIGGFVPTPVQWEKAAGGPDGRVYPWGAAAPDGTFANFAHKGRLAGARPVGSHPKGVSPYGVHDMAGNVYDRAMMRGAPVMVKGGSWLSPHPLNLRVADMCVQPMAVADKSVGFRCAMADPDPARATKKARAKAPSLKLARSWDAAVKEARERRVPIFLSLQFDTCGQCDRTRAQLFRDPRFVAYCNRNMVVVIGHKAAPQPGIEDHEENDDGTCPLYPGLECVEHHEMFPKGLAVVRRFAISPGNFVLHPDRLDQQRKAVLVGERALPKWGLDVEAYLQAFEKARAAVK